MDSDYELSDHEGGGRSGKGQDKGIAGRTRKKAVITGTMQLDNSDDDFGLPEDDDDDEYDEYEPKKKQRRKGKQTKINDQLKGANGGYAWEDELKRSWDIVKEDKQGSLSGIVNELVEANKLKKIFKNVQPFQRGIIRTLILVIDCTQAMTEKDLRPNRYALTVSYALDFVGEFFDQNPISQLGIVAMRNGVSTIVSDVSGNPADHINNLKKFKKTEPKGEPSLQNALEMARGLLLHTSPHSTKEVLILFGTLFSSDPGDIFKTINHLVNEKIRVRIIGLNAEVSICSKIVKETNFGDVSNYGIVLNEQHYKELLTDCVAPLPIAKSSGSNEKNFNLIKMGFPERITEDEPSFCSCHSKLNFGGYICPFCSNKICSLPSICPTCNLMLISSLHLARSYHHLFPLKNFQEVPMPENTDVAKFEHDSCFSCQHEFPIKNNQKIDPKVHKTSSRFSCQNCKNNFCVDCSVFAHEILHNCPGCESTII